MDVPDPGYHGGTAMTIPFWDRLSLGIEFVLYIRSENVCYQAQDHEEV